MINFQVVQSKAPNHICELQISHSSMFNARKGLPGHLYYGIVRKALEMMDFKNTVQDGDEARSKIMYSSDLAALLDFMPDDIDKVSWKGWVDDTVSLGNWEGVTTNAKQQIVAIDLKALDPNLEHRHRLSHIEELDFTGLGNRLGELYFKQIGKDYQHFFTMTKICLRGCEAITDDMVSHIL